MSEVRENLGDFLVEVEASFEENESKSCFSGEFPDSIIVMSVGHAVVYRFTWGVYVQTYHSAPLHHGNLDDGYEGRE